MEAVVSSVRRSNACASCISAMYSSLLGAHFLLETVPLLGQVLRHRLRLVIGVEGLGRIHERNGDVRRGVTHAKRRKNDDEKFLH